MTQSTESKYTHLLIVGSSSIDLEDEEELKANFPNIYILHTHGEVAPVLYSIEQEPINGFTAQKKLNEALDDLLSTKGKKKEINVLYYKNYYTEIHYSVPDEVLYGKIENISDLVNFESKTVEGIAKEFYKACDDYEESRAQVLKKVLKGEEY